MKIRLCKAICRYLVYKYVNKSLLFFQKSNDEDGLDFTDLGYNLREKLLPLVNSAEDEQKLSVLDRAKKLQKLLDSQICKLQKDKQMLSFLEMSVKDVIPCNMEHQVHYRRVLEILIGRLNIKCKLSEKVNKKSSCVTFEVVPMAELQFSSPKPEQQRSQLHFEPAMLEVNNIFKIMSTRLN